MRRLVLSALFAAALTMTFSQVPVAGQDKSGVPEKLLDKITQALPEKAPVQPRQPRKILIYSKTAGFRHGSIPYGIKAITMMGDKTGAYTALATEDESFFEPSKLKAFDAVFMLNTTGDCLKPKIANENDAQQVEAAIAREEMLKKSFEEFVAGGKGLIGVHSAGDTYHDKRGRFTVEWPAYNKMMGGAFRSHPWHQKVPVKNLDPTNPVNAAFEGKDFEITDEIYMYRDDTALPNERHYLLALDTNKMSPQDVAKGNRKDGRFPVAWITPYGKGRNFYCSLGHREEIYWNPMILRHYLAGIQYALGDLDADAAPNTGNVK
jgi:type 1 glutamine amidotransferase